MIYFDNAATTRFKPLCVKTAVIKELSRSANPGRSGHDASIRAATEVEDVEGRGRGDGGWGGIKPSRTGRTCRI